ncbi:MAG: hypothetical protein ABIN74_02615 [Ferruginibacter sp.]
MKITRYKPFFSVRASYVLTGIGVSTQGISVYAVETSQAKMSDLKLKAQYKQNAVTVFYEGTETPPVLPVTSEPDLEISTPEKFYFGVSLADQLKIKRLKFHSTPAKQIEIGFPLLYDASINILAGPATVSAREDVKIISPLFTFTAPVAGTGITADHASLVIRDEANVLVNLDIPPVKVNDKTIDGPGAIPEFAFSVDASKLEAGIYEFKVGTYTRKFFLTGNIDTTGMVCLVRVIKNNFLLYKKALADKTFEKFELQIQAA